MSQFPSVPPPGAYTRPNQSPQPQGHQQPHHGYQQPQAPSAYGASGSGHTPSASQKPTNSFGQVFNQAVTQGKPMLDKLGKSISSKLGNKHSKQAHNPQYAPQESYQNYQHGQTQAQQYQQIRPQTHSNAGQQYSPGSQSLYQTPQQSPFTQSAYGTPASGNSGQNNYFPQQAPPTPHQQAPSYQQALQQTPYQHNNNTGLHVNSGEQAHSHNQPGGQTQQGQSSQAHSQGLPPQTLYGQASGQQTGVIGGAQHVQNNFQQHPPSAPPPQENQQQQQWASPAPSPHQHTSPVPQSPGQQPGEPQHHWAYQAAAPHQHAPPTAQSPTHFNPTPPPQPYNAAPPVPSHPNHQQPQQSAPSPHQQWTSRPPASPHAQQEQPSTSGSSPLPQRSEIQKPATPVTVPQQQQQYRQNEPLPQEPVQLPTSTSPKAPSKPDRTEFIAELPPQEPVQLPTSTSPKAPSKPDRTEFIAELPADLGSMSLLESPKTEQAPSNVSQAAPYRAYQPPSEQRTSPGPGHTIARRAVSTSSLPFADPWRFADPVSELPTREFYIIADLVFDSIDKRFEPQNTGLLEASKVLESWKAQQLPEEAAELFAHDSYSAFGKIWSLEGVPHVLVPCQPSLMPTWNFQQQLHSQELTLQEGMPPAMATYPVYMPALNRAGWYKYSFLNWLHQPEDLEKMLSAFCADTYHPGTLNQPDIQKRDKNESPALVSRAAAISNTAVGRVCQEVVAQMQGASRDGK